MFVPFVNFVMAFILGAKGSSWAWRNKKWESVEQFKVVQKKWARWAIVVYFLLIAFVVALFFAIMLMIKSSDAFKLAEAKLQSSPQASEVLGKPISTGFPSGSIATSGPSGKATISFSVVGTKGKGKVYFDAVKEFGKWKINNFILEESGTGERTDLNEEL